MQLTRRDAAAALAALGVAGGAALGTDVFDSGRAGVDISGAASPDEERVRTVMTAIARVVYPDAVSGVSPFVNAFLDGRLADGEHAVGMRETVAELDELATEWHGAPVDELSGDTRDTLLREVGADTADEDPAGTTAERVRYYVVNELLLALYTSPTGGRLVGLENPPGHPGGTASYHSRAP